jgi:hypothetical protein
MKKCMTLTFINTLPHQGARPQKSHLINTLPHQGARTQKSYLINTLPHQGAKTQKSYLINTLLQQGARPQKNNPNCFNSFFKSPETRRFMPIPTLRISINPKSFRSPTVTPGNRW